VAWRDDGLGVVDCVGDRRRGHTPTQLAGDVGWYATRRDHHRLSGLTEQAGDRLPDVPAPITAVNMVFSSTCNLRR
jgi:hypothetical protein